LFFGDEHDIFQLSVPEQPAFRSSPSESSLFCLKIDQLTMSSGAGGCVRREENLTRRHDTRTA